MQSSSVSLLQGDYEKALKCDCLSHFEISDARRPLYKVRKPFPSYFLSQPVKQEMELHDHIFLKLLAGYHLHYVVKACQGRNYRRVETISRPKSGIPL